MSEIYQKCCADPSQEPVRKFTDAAWLDGPTASGHREFVMPLPTNSSWVHIPSQIDSLSKLDYTDHTLPALAPAVNVLSQDLGLASFIKCNELLLGSHIDRNDYLISFYVVP